MERTAAIPANLTWECALITNLRLLGFPSTEVALSRDLFLRPNKRAFQAVVLFLFEALDKMETARRFDTCRRCTNRRQELDFAKVTCAWLAELSDEGRLPRVTPSLIAAPQGEKVYEVLTKLSTVVLRRRLVSDLGCSHRDLLHPPSSSSSASSTTSSLPHASSWRSAGARSLLCGISSERQRLLDRLSRLDPLLAARHDAIRGLERRYRRAGADLNATEAELAALGGVTGDGIDVGRLQRLQELWRQLMSRVEGLAPAMTGVAALLQESNGPAVLDGARLAPEVPPGLLGRRKEKGEEEEAAAEASRQVYSGGRVDLLGLLGAVRAGASACESGQRRRTPARTSKEDATSGGIETSAKDCLACLQGQISELETLIDRVGTTLPDLQSSCASLRSSYRRRHPRRLPTDSGAAFSPLPAVINGATAAAASPPTGGARLSLGTPPATPPSVLSNGWRTAAAAAAAASVSASSSNSSVAAGAVAETAATTVDDIEALLDQLASMKRRQTSSTSTDGTPRAVSSASVTRDGDQLRAKRRSEASPPMSTSSDGANLSSLNEESLPKLSSRFRLSLDRLGLQSSEEEQEEEEEDQTTSEDIAEAEDATPKTPGALGDAELGDLVMETSSILLGSSHSDYDDSFEADSLVSV